MEIGSRLMTAVYVSNNIAIPKKAIFFFLILEFAGVPGSIRDCVTRGCVHASVCKVSGDLSQTSNLVYLLSDL